MSELTVRVTSWAALVESADWPKLNARSPASCSRTQEIGTVTSWVTTATKADSPSIRRGFARIVEIAPSRISPTPSGRSGMTPGFGGCHAACWSCPHPLC